MSFSKAAVSNPRTVAEVCFLYRETLLTQEQIGWRLFIAPLTVHEILRRNIPGAEKAALKRKRYRASKLGGRNPMLGKKPGNHLGECEDGHGYLTQVIDKERYFVHRIIMAELLGLHVGELPAHLVVHHIDNNPKNNHPNNLALVTTSGHRAIHRFSKPPGSR